MIITGKDYIIEKLGDSYFFNLKILTTINKGKDTERKDFKTVGYGIAFETCIQYIIDYRMREMEGELTVNEYFEKYKDFVEILEEDFE